MIKNKKEFDIYYRALVKTYSPLTLKEVGKSPYDLNYLDETFGMSNVDTLAMLLFFTEKFDSLCVPPNMMLWVCVEGGERKLITYQPDELAFDAIRKCRRRFVAIPLSLDGINACNKTPAPTAEESSHSNLLLIDKKRKTMERLDPWMGLAELKTNKDTYEQEKLNAKLKQMARHLKLKYVSGTEICPIVTTSVQNLFQAEAAHSMGACALFALFMLYLRLANPDLDPAKLETVLLQTAISMGEQHPMYRLVSEFGAYIDQGITKLLDEFRKSRYFDADMFAQFQSTEADLAKRYLDDQFLFFLLNRLKNKMQKS